MNIEKENNNELFFKELKSKTCNPEILYNISLKGIYLYKPLYLYKRIKYHEYVVDISLMNKQYFIIYNDKQYERLIEKFEKYEDRLIILNEYIIKNLVNDNNNSYILTLLKEYSHISLYCLLKHNYISYKIFDYLKYDTISYIRFIFITFYIAYYLKENINLKNIKYIIINICNNIKYDYCYDRLRLYPIYPLNLLKIVSSKLYKLNILYFKHDDKNIEDFINSICGDSELRNINNQGYINIFSKQMNPIYMNIKLQRYKKLHYLWFENKDLFNINFELKKYHLKYNGRYNYSYHEIDKFSLIFRDKYLNDDELSKVLKDPEYILYKSENDTTMEHNYFYTIILRCCVIESLIYNNKSKFVINTLTELLNNYVPLSYNFKENKLRFERTEHRSF
ncbi:hypothetical protein U3516DRAFT_810931 [Neocallimastix sp. 'constans']